MVDLNITLWIQLANFLVTLVVLNYLLISPIRKIIRKRKDNVEGLIGEIEAFTAEKQQLLDEYESELRRRHLPQGRQGHGRTGTGAYF